MQELLMKLGMPDDARKILTSLLSEKRLVTGEVLFDYNDVGTELFYVQDGNLAVHKFTGFLEKMQVIALLDPGSVIGEAALLGDHHRKIRATAIGESLLFCLSRNDFILFRKQFPESAFDFLEYLLLTVGVRLEKTSERLARIL